MKKHIGFIIILLILFTSCKQNEINTQQKNNLAFVEVNYPKDIFPATIQTSEESHIITQIHCSLLKYNTENESPKGSIAKRWFINNSHDKITFYLNNNVFFHDDPCFENGKGRKVLADDVKKSMEYSLLYKAKHNKELGLLSDIKGGKKYFNNYKKNKFQEINIEGIKVIDSLCLEIYLQKPNPAFIYSLMAPNMSIIPIEGLKKYGDNCMVGCGPFKVEHFDSSTDSIVLSKHNHYFITDSTGKQLPYLDEIIVYYKPVPNVSLRMLRNEKIDFLLTMQKKHVTLFLEENIDLFETKNPRLVLEQAKGLEHTDIFLIRRSNICNLKYSNMNILYLESVYFEETSKNANFFVTAKI